MLADNYKPKVLVSTLDLPEADWLEYRRRGIGGSDAAAIFGVSPFKTARDLYYDKLKIASFDDDNANWVQKEVGHLLEDLVAKIFHEKTGFRVYQIKKMFYHPVHSFMLADVDYFIELPNGKTAILEIKTTNYNAKDNWWIDGVECVPVYYELQGRHYMCVMNLDEVYFCCLYGNNENEVIIRHITRDKDYEDELIGLESNFWHNHIQRHKPIEETPTQAVSKKQTVIEQPVIQKREPIIAPAVQVSAPVEEIASEIAIVETVAEPVIVKAPVEEPKVETPAEIVSDNPPAAETVSTPVLESIPIPTVEEPVETASAEGAVPYTTSTPVEEICKLMSVEEALNYVITTGSCKGWTMAQAIARRPASVRFYTTPGYKGDDNILRASAAIVLKSLEESMAKAS